MQIDSLIDFAALGQAIFPVVAGGVGASVLIGGAVLTAKLVWGFFKKFTRG